MVVRGGHGLAVSYQEHVAPGALLDDGGERRAYSSGVRCPRFGARGDGAVRVQGGRGAESGDDVCPRPSVGGP